MGTFDSKNGTFNAVELFPVAFKMLEKKEDWNDIPFIRRVEHKKTLCQLITLLVRSFDWTVGAIADDLYPICALP